MVRLVGCRPGADGDPDRPPVDRRLATDGNVPAETDEDAQAELPAMCAVARSAPNALADEPRSSRTPGGMRTVLEASSSWMQV